MLLADRRIELDARPAPARAAPLEVVMLGHCPPEGDARWDRVARDEPMLAEIAALGFTDEVARLRAWQRGAALPEPPAWRGASDAALRGLHGLPLPIRSLGHFQTLFPQAFEVDADRASRLAGARAWLPRAVQDFFDGHEAGFEDTRTLWVIRVPQAEGVAAFLPSARPDFADPAALAPFDRALVIPRAGIVALPDLERLLVPAQLEQPPRLRVPNDEPVFLPLGTDTDDDHRERRRASEMPVPDPDAAVGTLLAPVARALARHRPDMIALLSVPFAPTRQGELPVPAPGWLQADTRGDGIARLGDALRQVQLLYPYLRDAGRDLVSASGLVAGAQARVAQRHGPWRSVAGRALPGAALPWPPVSTQQAAGWRAAGLSVLQQRGGALRLDDETLPAPVLPAADLAGMPRDDRARAGWRSAEVHRFMGYVRRELRALGERLLFDGDPRDPRPEQALRSFFAQLFEAGALRGARPEQAFRIRALPDLGSSTESTLAFEIELAPAFPIDLIRITFMHDRADGLPRITATLDGEAADG